MPRHKYGFTLIELLTVIAIIGILAAILIPTSSAVRVSAKKAKTKLIITQWTTAMEQFKQEYGYYPAVTTSDHLLDPTAFFPALTGRDYAGVLQTGNELNGNKRRLTFYSVSDTDQLKNATGEPANGLVDAFDNSDFVILFDTNGDGFIKGAELVLQSVRSGNLTIGFGDTLTPDETQFPTTGIRAPIIIYSAGRGSESDDIVYSWK